MSDMLGEIVVALGVSQSPVAVRASGRIKMMPTKRGGGSRNSTPPIPPTCESTRVLTYALAGVMKEQDRNHRDHVCH